MLNNHGVPAEVRRQAVQAALDAQKTATERNRLGQFATPIALAVEIARYVEAIAGRRLDSVRFADPSIGTGSFFSAALAVFGRERLGSAVGVEIDPEFAAAARGLWSASGLDVVQGDFTKIIASADRPPSPNLVLANPPYVRHHHLDASEKKRLQALALELTEIRVNGLAGLYVYFCLLATVWMAPGGYAAWLVPSEFMDVNYGAALKQFLTDRVTLLRVHRFDPADVQFGDALVSSCILVFRNEPPASEHAVEFTLGGSLAGPRARALVPLGPLRNSRKWTAYPNDPRNDRHSSNRDDLPTLGDLFRIQRGIATGGNKFFVLDRQDAERLGLPDCYLRPILPSPRHLKTTEIDGDEDGHPRIDRPLCLIDCDLPEPVLQAEQPALWEYLSKAADLGVRDGYLVRKRNPWYKQERRAPAPYLCTYMGRGSDQKQPFRLIWNRSRAIATNLYLMLFPRENLSRLLRDSPEAAGEVFALLGELTGYELRGEGRVYGGGLNKIEPAELGRVRATRLVSRWPELGNGQPKQGTLFG